MTYCLALRLDEGIIFLSDTRTNAGVDNVSTYRKTHVLRPAEDRIFVLQSAGNLATTQEVLDRIEADLARPGDHTTLANVAHLHDAALYIGQLSQMVASNHWAALNAVGADGTASFILGGQVQGERPDIMLVYPEGNYIRASDDRPFLQIGETKYGKYMLELAADSGVSLETGAKIALSSMVSTAHANLSVGPPYDLSIYRNGSIDLTELRVEPDSPYLVELQEVWHRHQMAAIDDLPPAPPSVDLG